MARITRALTSKLRPLIRKRISQLSLNSLVGDMNLFYNNSTSCGVLKNQIRPEPYPDSRTTSAWNEFLVKLYNGWDARWTKSNN
jgi:hypothetical protein